MEFLPNMEKVKFRTTRPKSQIETDKYVLDFLGDIRVERPMDMVKLRNHIQNSLEFREYNEQTKKNENKIRWKRTASEIIQDGYVYRGKDCSDLSIVFLALCKALGISGYLIKLANNDNTHSIIAIELDNQWYRLDITMTDSVPLKGRLPDSQKLKKNGWKVWKVGRDLWDLGLDGIDKESIIYNDANGKSYT